MEAQILAATGYSSSPVGTSHTLPVTPVVGQWVLALWTAEASGAGPPIPPAGWTTIRPFGSLNSASTATTAAFGAYAKIYAGAEDLVWTIGTVNTNVPRVKVLTGTGGGPVSSWVFGTFEARAVNATTTTAVAPSVTAVYSGLAISIASERTLAAETPDQLTVTNSTKFGVEIPTWSGGNSLVIASKRLAAGESTGPVTFTFPNPHAQNSLAGTIIISDEPAGVVDRGMPVRMHTESSVEKYYMKVVTDSGLVTPRAAKAVSNGYGSVDQMLATPAFKIAHRGGSVDYAEMSLYAYGQSALLGYNALEVSLARTSDGVLFGLHDDTMLRTSGVDVLASSLTWAQVQTYLIHGKQPYTEFQKILDLYPNHVIFVDPKAIPTALHKEVLDVMDSNGGPRRFVFKYYGASNYYLQPRARGYKTWGYFYELNIPTIGDWQVGWDILGMEYIGSQEAWGVIKSYNKPVVGHICPNLAAATTALAKGATGLMVSGVKSIASL